MKPKIFENFADNGAHSHFSVIDTDTGETIIGDILMAKKLLTDIFNGYNRAESDEWVCFSLTGAEAGKLLTSK